MEQITVASLADPAARGTDTARLYLRGTANGTELVMATWNKEAKAWIEASIWREPSVLPAAEQRLDTQAIRGGGGGGGGAVVMSTRTLTGTGPVGVGDAKLNVISLNPGTGLAGTERALTVGGALALGAVLTHTDDGVRWAPPATVRHIRRADTPIGDPAGFAVVEQTRRARRRGLYAVKP